MNPFPLASVRPAFRAAAQAFVPELATAGSDTWHHVEQTIVHALGARPPALTRQLAGFVRMLDLIARVRAGGSLHQLSAERRTALLRRLERSRLLLVRRGLAGLRTLVFMGYYTAPDVVSGIGYRASASGWEARR